LFRLQDDAPTTASRLLRLISVESGPVTAAEAFTAVARLIAALAVGEVPLVIVVEDLHWAEPTLIDLLQFLVGAVRSPVLFIGTAREDFLDQGHARLADCVIHMQPLSDDAARALLAQHTRLGARETEAVVERADGNPFFLEQLAAWRSEGQLGVPPDVVGVIAARLDSLDFEARLVIEAASVVGRDFLPRALETLIGDEPGVNVPRGLLNLESRGFVASGASSASQGPTGLSGVFGGGRLHFSHTLVFDAVRGAMPKARRADLHERFAADLKQRPGYEAAVAAYHLEQAARLRMELRPRDGLPEVALAAAAQLEQASLEALEHGDAPAATALLSRARVLRPYALNETAAQKSS
jgi:predicted ATPase